MARFPIDQKGSSGSDVRFISLSQNATQAEISRNGAKIPEVTLDEDRIADFIIPDLLDGVQVQQRVVSQSIRAGTRVPRGTAVDIVLANPFLVDVGFVQGAHLDLVETNLGTLAATYLSDPVVKRAVQQAGAIEDLPPATRTQLESLAVQNGLTLSETTPGRDPQSFFRAVQAAGTFS